MSANTALLLFYRDSVNESKIGIYQSSAIFSDINDHLINKLSYQPYDLILYSEDQQKGDDFGSRYYNALKETFALGYEKIISIGNDTPQLSVNHIQQADQQSGHQKICIGPSNDGGFYLLALHRSDFENIDFNKIDWQTSRVFRQLTDQLDEKCITFDKLRSLTDIDDVSSLQKVLQDLPQNNPLKKTLLGGLARPTVKASKSKSFQEHQYIAHFLIKVRPDRSLLSNNLRTQL